MSDEGAALDGAEAELPKVGGTVEKGSSEKTDEEGAGWNGGIASADVDAAGGTEFCEPDMSRVAYTVERTYLASTKSMQMLAA